MRKYKEPMKGVINVNRSYETLNIEKSEEKQKRPHTALNVRKTSKSFRSMNTFQKNVPNITQLSANKSQKHVSKLTKSIQPHMTREI